ncbi:DUF4336 domain-containing protein [Blastomonas aquatica]|uniref:DUF4336 domain-containing protein n=1 Tax=Blastomonas aquatica TaxID=1510276 RepID=A0ABQ1JQ30_9SPHN|nr:DUF4336 domain-containing protein [Blastomonas aquatica]GGB71935.1 hypothetical protein GCM10010833_28920 [Blastomonas aquatica]
MTEVYEAYQPQLLPVSWGQNIWTVEGPEVNYRLAVVTIACPTRMTVVQLKDGTLWLHSPVCYSPALAEALDALGPVSVLVAPNSYHYLHITAWAAAYPDATIFAAADVALKIKVPVIPLTACEVELWPGDILHTVIELGSFTEAVFFHVSSRTLIVTDLMQNFEARRVRNFATRAILAAGGATGPNGRPSMEIRFAARQHSKALHVGVRQMLDWRPERIILAHGACYTSEAPAEIERAFAWVKAR